MKVPFVDLTAQYATIADEVQEAITAVVKRGDFILGRDVALFEEEYAAYCGAKYAIGLDSGTSALELTLRAFDIGSGHEVITAANTFIATALAISYTGAKPVLVDIDPNTYNIDPARIEAAITERTRAIIPVHLYGQPADMDAILEIARRYGLIVIEDACQAHGAHYKGRRVGTFGHAAAFSFYPAKNLGAYGDGGMVVTDNPEIAGSIRMLRDYGQRAKYQHVLRGYNRRLDTIQAAVLRVKLKYLDAWNAARREHAGRYSELLAQIPGLAIPGVPDYATPVHHLYVIRVEERDSLRAAMQEKGVSTGIHYPIPIHLQDAYRDLGYLAGSFPITERCAGLILSLPIYAELTPAAIESVVELIREFTYEPAGVR
jgi:dTDP-4-amino-4,6-dideoxygalactose transaminase